MHTFDIMLITSAVCGVMMVAGSIALLYRGAIKFAAPGGAKAANAAGGLMVKLWNKVEIATGSPVLGLFVVGLLFVALALYFALPPAVPSITFTGATDEPYPDVRVVVTAEVMPYTASAAGKQLMGTARPVPDRVRIAVTAPGYLAEERFVEVPPGDVALDLKTVRLKRSESEYAPSGADPAALPRPDASLPPPGRASFGRGSQP
jgi:hypothetical protein